MPTDPTEPTGQVVVAISLSIDVDGLVDGLFAMRNPAKLAHLGPPDGAPAWTL